MESLNGSRKRLLAACCALAACGCRGNAPRVAEPESTVAVTAPRIPPEAGAGGGATQSPNTAASNASADASGPRPMVLPGLARGFAPSYPEMSRRLGEEGTVGLRLEVRSDGAVVSIAVTTSSGYKRLDAAALAAARTWQFNPRTGPYGVEVLLHRLVFRLEDDG